MYALYIATKHNQIEAEVMARGTDIIATTRADIIITNGEHFKRY